MTRYRSNAETARLEQSYELLIDDGNRQILQYFLGRLERSSSRDEIVAYLTNKGSWSHRTHEETEVILHHHNLPQLAAAGILEYDPTSGKVTYLGDEVIEKVLEESIDLPTPNLR